VAELLNVPLVLELLYVDYVLCPSNGKGNFYDSYQDAFYYLYDKVPIGGIVILGK
jgi:hypothetical protein